MLLRALAAWPRLAFVDFSNGGGSLAGELDPIGVPCVTPDDLPAFFGLDTVPPPPRLEIDPGEIRAWRAALALGGRTVDRATAYALRRELKLEISPWAFHLLWSGEATDATRPRNVGGGLTWSAEGRATLVAWLAETSFREPAGLRKRSLLAQALDFWQRRLAKEAEERGRRGPLDPWKDRPAERHLRMERALLRLWREPSEAAEELFGLRRGELGEEIRGRLSQLTPRDCVHPDDGRVSLPWRLENLGDRERFLLTELGLGGVTRGSLRRPGRLGLGVGLLASLGLGLLGFGLWNLWAPPGKGEPTLVESGERPPPEAHAFAFTPELGTMTAGTARGTVATVQVSPGAEVRLTWTRVDDQPCIDGSGEAQRWRCGSSPRQATTRGVSLWPRRSLAALAAPAADDASRRMAAALIDSGSADTVLLGLEAASRLDEVLGTLGEQLLYIRSHKASAELPAGFSSGMNSYTAALTADDLDPLIDRLAKMDGIFSIEQVWAPWLDEPKAEQRGMLSNCPWQEGEHLPTGMRFVRICGGTFPMGSVDDDPLADDAEKPVHGVIVGGFWMAETEVTNVQYRDYKPKHPGEGDLPAVEISWFEARDYCRALTASEDWPYDLPTEAQWEFAARAGTLTAWSFGDDDSVLGDHAWFDGNSGKKAHEVGTRLTNPWGLYDMHGNVWEWVLDCLEDYGEPTGNELIADPGLRINSCHEIDKSLSADRILRGGSAWSDPRDLRSAYRYSIVPKGRFDLIGFRCVRGPRR